MDSKNGSVNLGVAALLSVACGAVSAWFLPAAVLLPVLGIYYGIRKSWYLSAGFLLLGLIAVHLLAGTAVMLMLGIFTVPVLIVGVFVIQRKWNPFESVAMCIGAVFVGVMLAYVFANAMMGGDALGTEIDAFSSYLISLPQETYKATMTFITSSAGLDIDLSGDKGQVVAYVASHMEMLVRGMLPTLILAYSAIAGLFSFAFTRKRLQMAKADVVPMVPFWDYQLPVRFARGAVFIILLGLLLQLVGDDWLAQLGVLTNTLFIVCFVVQGFAVIDYFLLHRSIPRPLRWIVLVLAYALFGTVLFVVGVLDQVLGIRSRIAT